MKFGRLLKIRPLLVALLGTVGLHLSSQSYRAQERRPITIAEGFDAYARGEFVAIADAIERVDRLRAFTDALRREAPTWIDAGGPDQVPHRRLVVASVAVEAAAEASDWIEHPTERFAYTQLAVKLTEWACGLARQNRIRTPAEHTWHRAALAVLQKVATAFRHDADARDVIRAHIRHAQDRFPDDSRWKLASAHASSLSQRGRGGPPRVPVTEGPLERQARGHWNRTIREFGPLTSIEELRDEAHLRLGHAELRRGRPDTALSHLAQIRASTADPGTLYMAHFFRGQILASRSDLDGAAAAYESALTQWPTGQLATIALAAIKFQRGQRQQAIDLVRHSLSNEADDDPWRSFVYGDFRFWPKLRDQLRNDVR
jgi:tetratricopeptide (TPR) repeat protein